MKTKGAIAYIGVSLKELNELYKEDAVIHVSKKFLNAHLMISGAEEESKPVNLKVTDNTEKIAATNEIKPEVLPPIELNISEGDW